MVMPRASRSYLMPFPGWGGFFIGIVGLSVIVDEIDAVCIALGELEYDAPVGAHCDRPIAAQLAFERMQAIAHTIHRFDRLAGIQGSENIRDTFHEVLPQLRAVVGLEEASQPLMPEASDHL